MKPTASFRVALLALVLNGLLSELLAQGPLTPPGPPGPTMKTLQQIEPRTPISALPFLITTPGSYYLAGNLAGVSGQNGITVQASNVTIDLAGFALSGGAGSLSAVQVAAGVKNLALVNGTAQDWGGDAVSANSASACRFEQLRILGNLGAGLRAGSNAFVAGCTILNNSGDGIAAASASRITGNSLVNNGNTATAAGIRVSSGSSRVEGNHVVGGTGFGFRIEGAGNLIVRNSASGNGASAYSIANGNDFGQILSPGANFTHDVPWANFGTGTGAVCGNGILEVGETCDDGNTVSGDGCSSTCQVEGCTNAAQCPGVDTDCKTRTCVAGACGFSFASFGVPTSSQTPGDCRINVCDGAGNVVSMPDNTDIPADDGNQCTTEMCSGGTPVHPAAAAGTACSQNGGRVCNGAGACVACISASDCPGTDTACRQRTCSGNVCGSANSSTGTTCAPASCNGSVLILASNCDGAGSCVSGNQVQCSPYGCNAVGPACYTTCSSDANCAAGFHCSAGVCQ